VRVVRAIKVAVVVMAILLLKTIKSIVLLILSLLLCTSSCIAYEVEIDNNGISSTITSNNGLQITVYNNYDDILDINWSAEDNINEVNEVNDKDVLIMHLGSSEDSIINTFEGHTFYGILNKDNNRIRADPFQITVSKHITSYSFGPSKETLSKS